MNDFEPKDSLWYLEVDAKSICTTGDLYMNCIWSTYDAQFEHACNLYKVHVKWHEICM